MPLLPLVLVTLGGLLAEEPPLIPGSASNCTWQNDTDYAPTSSSGTFRKLDRPSL